MQEILLYGTAVQTNDFITSYVARSLEKHGIGSVITVVDEVDKILDRKVTSIPCLYHAGRYTPIPNNGSFERTLRSFVRDVLNNNTSNQVPEIVVGLEVEDTDYDIVFYALRMAIDLRFNVRLILNQGLERAIVEDAVERLESSMLEEIGLKPFVFYECWEEGRSLKSYRRDRTSFILIREDIPCPMYSDSCGKIVVPIEASYKRPSSVAILSSLIKRNAADAVYKYAQDSDARIDVLSTIEEGQGRDYDLLIGVCSCAFLKKQSA